MRPSTLAYAGVEDDDAAIAAYAAREVAHLEAWEVERQQMIANGTWPLEVGGETDEIEFGW